MKQHNVSDFTNSIWTKNGSLIRLHDAETNLTTAMAAVIKESDFIYGKGHCLLILSLILLNTGLS
jgi:hypothetical protein